MAGVNREHAFKRDRSTNRRRRSDWFDPCDRSRTARRSLHHYRAKAGAGLFAEDGKNSTRGPWKYFAVLDSPAKIRAAGLRKDVPMDVFIIQDMTRPPLLRLHYPSVEEALRECRATNDGSAPLESYQLISQYTLEPLLKHEAEQTAGLKVRFGCEFLSMEQDTRCVTATFKNEVGGTECIRATYLVGCDGGASPVRKALGIQLRGEGNLLELRQALYRCDELFDRLPIGNGPGRGRHYHVADDRSSFLIMQDSTRPLDAARGRRQRRRYEAPVRENHRGSGQIRDAFL